MPMPQPTGLRGDSLRFPASAVDEVAWDSDINDVRLPQPLLRCRVGEALLQPDECRCPLGPDSRSQRLAGIAIQAGGDIDGKDSG